MEKSSAKSVRQSALAHGETVPAASRCIMPIIFRACRALLKMQAADCRWAAPVAYDPRMVLRRDVRILTIRHIEILTIRNVYNLLSIFLVNRLDLQ
ncbi:MAG: hypothetical protein H7327_03135 [Herminiimonas sp.]|nr:hypothetical protein [Herminiimonas sp.]